MKRFATVWPLAALLALAASPAIAQPLLLEARGGLALPTGDLADGQAPGPIFGLGVGVDVHPRIGVRLDVDASFMEGETPGAGTELPGVNLVHYVLGLETPLFRSGASSHPLTLSAGLGAGATSFEVETFVVPLGRPQEGQSFSIQETYPTLRGGLRLAFGLGPSVDAVLAGQVYRVFADEDDTSALALIADEVQGPDSVWSVPVTLGVRFRL